MDLRDLVRSHTEVTVGHKAVNDSLNVRNEYRRFRRDPLESLITKIDDEHSGFMHGDIGRYRQAYSWYALCLQRCFDHISIARRADSERRYHPKNKKYSMRQKQLASKRNVINKYTELDYQNLIIHSCILLDRTIALSRRFIDGGNLPSFTSFNKHRQFLIKKSSALKGQHDEYVQYFTENTDWFDIPLKVLRDKYLMHSSEKHMLFFGWDESNWDLEMITIITADNNQDKLLEKVKVINFTPRRLARDVEVFLKWFSEYGASR